MSADHESGEKEAESKPDTDSKQSSAVVSETGEIRGSLLDADARKTLSQAELISGPESG